ncbi:hypothetical protein N7530_009781 [Penicillium desertorum]|uniref:Uncharacterized protein n=1 Tax=Penicillium desertorum TaxID=1303715 RepID=A0A9W9WJ56_9EURO|nr:hypothetical protein N7530_009781 [Penicillium desertorum]
MCSSTKDGHVPANSPTVVIPDLPVPGTATNPILIEEDYAPLGSERNPIMIHVAESPVYEHPEKSQAPRQSNNP